MNDLNVCFLVVILHITDDDIVDPVEDLRGSIEARKKRKMDVTQELVETKETLKRLTDEMDRMREEGRKTREELSEIRGERASVNLSTQHALGFRPNEYLAMSYVKSAEWVAGPLATRMKAIMKLYPYYFEPYKVINGVDSIGARTCAKFNRGEFCPTKWHKHDKLIRRDPGEAQGVPPRTRSELRIHCCVLCLEALKVIVGHPLMNCPWTRTSSWDIVFNTQRVEDPEQSNQQSGSQ